MAPPFEVPVASSSLHRWLWCLRHAPGTKAIYRQDLLKREIISYLAPMKFFELHEAVEAALGPGGAGEVRLVRNVTLPAPLNHQALCNRHGSTILWAWITEGQSLTIRSVGAGPWRIRHHVPGGNGLYGCALFGVGRNAQLKVEGVSFEIVYVRTATPLKANLAVLPPRDDPTLIWAEISEESDPPAALDVNDVIERCRAVEEVELRPEESDCKQGHIAESEGTIVQFSNNVKASGYDSSLVVRGLWAFTDFSSLFLSEWQQKWKEVSDCNHEQGLHQLLPI